jgi:3'(2'), 5'-bisphosphate nucleotidase
MSHLNLIIRASLEAGKAIMEIYHTGDFDVDMKSDFSPLTKADLSSNEIILKHLETTNIPILSEEGKALPYSERKNWDQLWIVDPLDGTKEFIKKNGEFTVNIALVENGIPIMGVVFAPALNELYFASKETGAFKVLTANEYTSEELINEAQCLPINDDRSTYRIVASRSHMSAETETFIEQQEQIHGSVETISRGSSLKLCMVAEGIADCYPRFAPTMEWDTAAGQAICMWSGAKVLNWNTQEPMTYNRENLLNDWFLVTR